MGGGGGGGGGYKGKNRLQRVRDYEKSIRSWRTKPQNKKWG